MFFLILPTHADVSVCRKAKLAIDDFSQDFFSKYSFQGVRHIAEMIFFPDSFAKVAAEIWATNIIEYFNKLYE